jgi:hypothetical protein
MMTGEDKCPPRFSYGFAPSAEIRASRQAIFPNNMQGLAWQTGLTRDKLSNINQEFLGEEGKIPG